MKSRKKQEDTSAAVQDEEEEGGYVYTSGQFQRFLNKCPIGAKQAKKSVFLVSA
jgi:hypothetical protein